MTNSSHPAIIIIHGLRGNHFGVMAIANTLEQEFGFKVYAPDLPGSGTRTELGNKTLDGYSDWLSSYIQELGLKTPPIIIGHSMGSIVVSYFVQQHPTLVDKRVILLSPIFRNSLGGVLSSIEYYLLSGFLHIFPKHLRYVIMKSRPVSYVISHFLTIDKSKQKQIDQLHYEYCNFASADSLLADMKISMQNQTIIPQDKIIFFCMGSSDRLTSSKLAQKRIRAVGQACKIIKHTGHLINYERPKTVARQIGKFINAN